MYVSRRSRLYDPLVCGPRRAAWSNAVFDCIRAAINDVTSTQIMSSDRATPSRSPADGRPFAFRAWHSRVCTSWCDMCRHLEPTQRGATGLRAVDVSPATRDAWAARLWRVASDNHIRRVEWLGHAAISLRSDGDASFDSKLTYYGCAACDPAKAPVPSSPDALVR